MADLSSSVVSKWDQMRSSPEEAKVEHELFIRIARKSKSLTDAEYKDFMMTLGDPTRPREDNKTICMKLMRDSKNYHARFRRDKQQQQKDAKIDGSKVVSVRKVSLSMKQVPPPFICLGDLVDPSEKATLSIGIGKVTSNDRQKLQIAETIVLLKGAKRVVFWCYINWPERFGQRFKFDKPNYGLPPEEACYLFKKIIHGTTLVGFDVKNDLNTIGISHSHVVDLSEYFCKAMRLDPVAEPRKVKYSMEDLTQKVFPKFKDRTSMQYPSTCTDGRRAIGSARMSAKLWMKMKECKEKIQDKTFYYDKIER